MSEPKMQVLAVPAKWSIKDVQRHLFDILQADHPLTADQRKALKGVIEMCDLWNKMSPGFAKVAAELKEQFNRHTNVLSTGPTAPPNQAQLHNLCRFCGQSEQNHIDRIGGARDCTFAPA